MLAKPLRAEGLSDAEVDCYVTTIRREHPLRELEEAAMSGRNPFEGEERLGIDCLTVGPLRRLMIEQLRALGEQEGIPAAANCLIARLRRMSPTELRRLYETPPDQLPAVLGPLWRSCFGAVQPRSAA